MRERGDLTLAEEEELAATLARLEAALPTPTKFSRTRNASHRNTHGLSWVKSTATDIVADLHQLADLLRRHGIAVEVAKTDRPGYVVYEDEWQVVAEPFHGERI